MNTPDPWDEIEKRIAAAHPGDVVDIPEGDYYGKLPLNPPPGVTIRGAGVDKTKFFPELPETPESHEPPLMTRGEMAFYGCFFVAIVGGIILLAVKIVSAWLELP